MTTVFTRIWSKLAPEITHVETVMAKEVETGKAWIAGVFHHSESSAIAAVQKEAAALGYDLVKAGDKLTNVGAPHDVPTLTSTIPPAAQQTQQVIAQAAAALNTPAPQAFPSLQR